MTNKRLSRPMQRALAKFDDDDEWHSAWDVQESLNTLYALRDRKMLDSMGHGHPGAEWSPATVLKWRKV